MVVRGSIRTLGPILAALLFISIGASAVMAAEPGCTIEVAPRAGAAGTVFVFSGTGFEPTQLTLHRNDADAGSHVVNVNSEDPWQVTVRSRPGDEGRWSAELELRRVQCQRGFPSYARQHGRRRDPSRSGPQVPLALSILVLAAGLGGGVVLGRRIRTGPIDNRVW